jgi:acyl carrier protein
MEDFIIKIIRELTFSSVTSTDSLWKDNILDSITIVELVVELEREYNISIPFNEIVTENFETVERISKYMVSKIGK